MCAWTGQSASSVSVPLATSSWTERLVAVNKDRLGKWSCCLSMCVCVCVCVSTGCSQLYGCLFLFNVPSLLLPGGNWQCHNTPLFFVHSALSTFPHRIRGKKNPPELRWDTSCPLSSLPITALVHVHSSVLSVFLRVTSGN